MKVFITGGTGFIGSHMVKKLVEDGHKLLLISRIEEKRVKNIEYLKGDLGNSNAWEKNVKAWRPNAVLHMAWEGIPNADAETSIKNLMNGLELLRIAKEAGAKIFIGLGSSLEYGGLKGRVSENMQGTPPNALYGAKKAFYEMSRHIAKEHKLQFVWTRPFYVYGPRQKKASLIPSILDTFHRGEKFVLKNPNAAEDFIYVEDVAEAIASIIKKCKKQEAVFNIGSGKPICVADIVSLVAAEYNKKTVGKQKLKPAPKDAFYADMRRIQKSVGWKPKISIREGIQKTVAYYKSNI